MIELRENERIDWFEITVDLSNVGIDTPAAASMINVPRSTITDWKNRNSTPRYYAAIRLLNLWMKMTGKELDQVPIYSLSNGGVPYRREIGANKT